MVLAHISNVGQNDIAGKVTGEGREERSGHRRHCIRAGWVCGRLGGAARTPPAQTAAVLRTVVLLPSAAVSPRVSPRVSGAQATDTPAPMRVMTAAMIIVGPMPMCDRACGTR